MKRFIYIASSGNWEMELRYADDGLLIFFELRERIELTRDMHAKVVEKFPRSVDDLEQFVKNAHGKMQEVQQEVTFEMFWDGYSKKINRLRAESLWKKMNEAERIQCYNSLKSYNRCLERTGRYKQDPETYLRGRGWETPWSQIK
ncbi:MAG: hypothetical protein WCL00_06095 [Bacteroidota bacterium]